MRSVDFHVAHSGTAPQVWRPMRATSWVFAPLPDIPQHGGETTLSSAAEPSSSACSPSAFPPAPPPAGSRAAPGSGRGKSHSPHLGGHRQDVLLSAFRIPLDSGPEVGSPVGRQFPLGYLEGSPHPQRLPQAPCPPAACFSCPLCSWARQGPQVRRGTPPPPPWAGLEGCWEAADRPPAGLKGPTAWGWAPGFPPLPQGAGGAAGPRLHGDLSRTCFCSCLSRSTSPSPLSHHLLLGIQRRACRGWSRTCVARVPECDA